MRFTEIGQQLRAYRLESGLRAEQIAAQLGVSRAALYRYEKGDVIKLDTVQRLAELLNVSALSLLGIGVEYYSRPVAFFERLRQIEESCDQVLSAGEPLAYLTTSIAYDAAMAMAVGETDTGTGAERAGRRASTEQLQGILAARKRLFLQRRPNLVCLMALPAVADFLRLGVAPDLATNPHARLQCRRAASTEIETIARLMEAEPMGLQFGIIARRATAGPFMVLRGRDRAHVVVNPLRPDSLGDQPGGVAIVTAADEAFAAHQACVETLWREAVKGPAGAAELRATLAAYPVGQ